jgi:hypothetical protein
VCCGVDAAGKARDDRQPGGSELGRKAMREHATVRAGVACPDHGDGRSVQALRAAAHREQRRRISDVPQPQGIGALVAEQQPAADAGEGCELCLCGRFVERGADVPGAAACQLGQSGKRALGRAEALKQLGEGERAHPFGAGQPNPGEAISMIESLAHAAQP